MADEARFGAGAARLVGLAARLLGWRPDETWRATPADLAAALAPPPETAAPLSRGELARMMEADDVRSG
ncbi:phage tail assembly chaperone [Parablastomonas sp. CN1-191]|uniref:phage tail assembly chaperone n=1 Tax=Parablastomonas sp. CN1-191 TaxID=3400908 RepID=UPI003BF8CA17